MKIIIKSHIVWPTIWICILFAISVQIEELNCNLKVFLISILTDAQPWRVCSAQSLSVCAVGRLGEKLTSCGVSAFNIQPPKTHGLPAPERQKPKPLRWNHSGVASCKVTLDAGDKEPSVETPHSRNRHLWKYAITARNRPVKVVYALKTYCSSTTFLVKFNCFHMLSC